MLLRVQGSYHIYGKPGNTVRISVPIHGNKDLKIGILKHLLKMAGLLENAHQENSTPEQSTSEDMDNESNPEN
ncbi:type II toxin-antitoxin system HicA family toxin [Argonema antarcticum A004/B2]|nr:type II toxin-antitoxin system HicA family toxin [Argonema antarcticum A004/B2]